jgi:hypothetical protein
LSQVKGVAQGEKLAHFRYAHADENIAFSIVSGSCFEKSLQKNGILRAGLFMQFLQEIRDGSGARHEGSVSMFAGAGKLVLIDDSLKAPYAQLDGNIYGPFDLAEFADFDFHGNHPWDR